VALPPAGGDGGGPDRHVTRVTTLLAGAGAALVLAAVALVVLSRPGPAKVSPRAAAQPVADVRVAQNRLGRILVDRHGHTLYLFLADQRGRSTCSDACARVWPPEIVGGRPQAGAGVSSAKLTTTRRSDHRLQVVYDGHPLYAMSADTRPGETAGQGFLGSWFVVSPAGRRIGRRRASAEGGY
jgi:predicted lipoprotein with Yx(FWY)xxD motif